MQDIFASSGWTPSRSTLDNITDGVEFVVQPLLDLMWKRVLSDLGVGIDDTNVTLLMPSSLPQVKQDDTPEQQLKCDLGIWVDNDSHGLLVACAAAHVRGPH